MNQFTFWRSEENNVHGLEWDFLPVNGILYTQDAQIVTIVHRQPKHFPHFISKWETSLIQYSSDYKT